MSKKLQRRPPRVAGLGDTIHRSRYFRQREGKTAEEIAKEDNVSLQAVNNSINMVETYYLLTNEDALRSAQQEIVLKLTAEQTKALKDALAAERRIYSNSGEYIGVEPDHLARLTAIQRINEKIEAITPKSKGTQVNVGVGVGIQHGGGGRGSVFEDRLNELMKQRGQYLEAGDVEERVIEGDEIAAEPDETTDVEQPEDSEAGPVSG